MKKSTIVFMTLLLLAGCGGASRYPGTSDGAKMLLSQYLKPGANFAAITNQLRPALKDYRAVFKDAATAEKMFDSYEKIWQSGRLVFKPKKGQTEILLWQASSEDLVSGGGNAGKFPGGYRRVATALKPGIKVYRWKFVKPGQSLGMAADGLYFVNGRWIVIPKPWRVLR